MRCALRFMSQCLPLLAVHFQIKGDSRCIGKTTISHRQREDPLNMKTSNKRSMFGLQYPYPALSNPSKFEVVSRAGGQRNNVH